MRAASIPNPRATLALAAYFLVANMINAVYAAYGQEPSAAYLLLYYLGRGLVVAHWILTDQRRLGAPRSLDSGWFAFIAWPLVLPYHLVKTRGWKGIGTLLGMIALYLVTYGLSLLCFFALTARNG